VLVNQRRRTGTRTLFRTVFYLPLLASTASVAIFMGYLFDAKFGVINYYLGLLGLSGVPWLTSNWGASVTIVLVAAWQQTGFTFVLFVAALNSVPEDVIEAAAIDGAGPLRTLLRVKIPLISPTILFAAVVAMINAMQLFDQPYIMTKGGPGSATTTATIVMYQSAFQNLQFGYGSAIAIVLLLIILAITGLQFLAARKLVFYQ
jgi:multiple sugar transport system permease protein